MLDNVETNVVLFSVEFNNVGQRRTNVVKMNISKRTPKKLFQIEYTEFKVLTAILKSILIYSLFMRNMLKNTCKAPKTKIMKNTAL